jgi:hypothetical protein
MKRENSLALIVAYYLSKYDRVGYENLGFKSLTEAHHQIGRILNVNPNSVKNMRDEFDPIHSTPRVGWYQRELRPSRLKVVESFQELSEEELRDIVLEILTDPNFSDSEEGRVITSPLRPKGHSMKGKPGVFVQRGPTGKKAEEYFVNYHSKSGQPLVGKLRDTRDLGCGYDFEIKTEQRSFFVEVKGLESTEGGVVFTSKEWDVAKKAGERYFLVVVRNISDKPEFQIVQDPAHKFDARKNIYTTVQVRWSISERELKSSK